MEKGFAGIARMQVPPLQDTALEDVTQWLANINESWLLILDNCDDVKIDLAEYMPSQGGSVIITTRLRACRTYGTWEDLDDLGPDTAAQLLLKASGLGDRDEKALTRAAESVVSILGQHALALVHAGAYIKMGYCSLSGYVQCFREEQIRLMDFKPKQQASRYKSVHATFEVSATALATSNEHDSHLALKLLNILAFLNREAVEENIFIKAFDECQRLERTWRVVWKESICQGNQCRATVSTQHDFVAEYHDDLEVLPRFERMKNVLCTWRGDYLRSTEGKVRRSEPIEPCCAIRPMIQSSETCQKSNDIALEQNVLPGTFEDAEVPDYPEGGVSTNDADAKDHEVHESGIHNSDRKIEANAGYDDADGDITHFCDADEDYGYYDDGEIDHPSIWHCNRIRSSGLVERRKTTRLRAACVRLANLSLVKVDDGRISMHPLVHEWARIRLSEVTRQHAWEQTLSILALVQCNIDRKPFCLRLVPHIDVCARDITAEGSWAAASLNVVRAFHILAWRYYYDHQFEASLAIFETLSISYHVPPHTWSHKGTLLLRAKAKCFEALGRYEDMLSCVTQILQVTNCWFDSDSLEAYQSQALLANTYSLAGNFQDEVDLYESLYKRNLETFVLSNREMPRFLTGLIGGHKSLGNHERAVELSIERLRITQKVYPPHHPSLRFCMSDLAGLYITVGAVEKAIALLEDEANLVIKQAWRDHESVELMSVLARAYEQLGRSEQASPILEEMHSYYTRTLSVEYSGQIDIMCRLAWIYRKLDNWHHAMKLLEEVVELDASILPLEDSGRLSYIIYLAEAYLKLEKPSQVVVLLEEVVGIDTTRLAPDHPERLRSIDLLVLAYLKLKKLRQAVPLMEEYVDIHATSLLTNDLSRLGSMNTLAKIYLELNRPEQAIPILEEVVRCFPVENSFRFDPMGTLAQAYIRRDTPVQAIPLLEQMIHCFSADNIPSLAIMNTLARVHNSIGQPNEAVTLLEELVQSHTSSPPDDMDRLHSIILLGEAYINLKRPEQAVTLLEEPIKSLLTDTPERPRGIFLLAQGYIRLDQPTQAVTLLEEFVKSSPDNPSQTLINSMALLADAFADLGEHEKTVSLLERIVAWDIDHLAEDNAIRLANMCNLAWAYTRLGTREKAEEVVSLYEKVMEKGRETLHADPEELRCTQERLADAREKLRQISEEQLPVDLKKVQGVLDVTADTLTDSTVYQHLRNLTKRAVLMF